MKNTTSTFAEKWEIDKPLRIAAFKKHYENKTKYNSISDAALKEKQNDHILKVTPIDGTNDFYILHTFDEYNRKLIYTGMVIGIWNELTVIG